MRELTVLSMLTHPNIVALRGLGYAESGNVYLALDYVDGWTLGEWKERKHPTFHEVLRVFVKIADALVYMHSRGILHRDLKLSNVLIRKSDGEPVIIDFSCATYTLAADLTESGLPPGTDRFRAPEAFKFLREHKEEHRGRYAFQVADEIFAVGAMLYELLTDPRPTEARLRESLNNPVAMPPPARGLNPRVPEPLSELVEDLLSRDPESRPVDTEALRRELAELLADPGADYQALAHAPSEQRQPEPVVAAELAEPRAPRRKAWRIAAGAGAAVVLAAVVALWMLPRCAARDRSPRYVSRPRACRRDRSGTRPRTKGRCNREDTAHRSPRATAHTTRTEVVIYAEGRAACLCHRGRMHRRPSRPEPFTCPEGSQRAMRGLHWNDGDQFSLVIDDRHDQWGTFGCARVTRSSGLFRRTRATRRQLPQGHACSGARSTSCLRRRRTASRAGSS